MSAVRLAFLLCLVEVRLLVDGGAAVFGDLLVGLAGAVEVGSADFWATWDSEIEKWSVLGQRQATTLREMLE